MQFVALNCISNANGGSGTNTTTTNVPVGLVEITLEARKPATCTFVVATQAPT
jgi:hypothetical protein